MDKNDNIFKIKHKISPDIKYITIQAEYIGDGKIYPLIIYKVE